MRRIIGFALLLVCATTAQAEQLPVRVYTTSDGLPRNLVNRIVSDPRGFLWICTSEGLALFDGYAFRTYGTAEGLPDAEVLDLLITRRGEYWVATRKGLARFLPGVVRADQPRFTAHLPGTGDGDARVVRLQEDAAGHIWCSTDNGVYRVVPGDGGVRFERVPLDLPKAYPRVVTFLIDRASTLWVATKSGLYRRRDGGRLDRIATADGLPHDIVTSLATDADGGLWVGTDGGLSVIERAADWDPRGAATSATRTWLAGTPVRAVFPAPDGTVWAGLESGLARLGRTSATSERALSRYSPANGLPPTAVEAIADDAEGNVWMGTSGGGAAKLAREGFVTYQLSDGLRSLHITSIFQSRAGDLYVTHAPNDGWAFRFDGARFVAVKPAFPAGTPFTWGWNQLAVESRAGDWWFASARGAWRFPPAPRLDALARTAPAGRVGVADGLPSDEVFRLFEDRRGDVWFGTLGASTGDTPTTLARWDRARGTIVNFPGTYGTATSFLEDRAGQIWIALYTGGLVRYRDGRFDHVTPADGLPDGTIFDLHLDRSGRVWAASSRGGLVCIDDPASAHPQIRVYTTRDGLSSNSIRCITEDGWGRIYVGTGRGVDRIDVPASGRPIHVRRYTTADGLAAGEPTVALRDRAGAIWVGTVQGLSKLVPQPERPGRPSPVFITGVQVEGVTRPLSAIGEPDLQLGELAANEGRLQIEFVGLGFAPGERLRYQYMVDGVDRDWSAAGEARRVNLAGLSPGGYRFLVRAVTADGLASPVPAAVAFSVPRPIWRRWWAQFGLVLLAAAAALAWHKTRLARVLALERVRMQIATDLHDEIGSGLTRVSILSDLARRELGGGPQEVAGPLDRIAELSRELAGSMGDIVWAVNPGKDHLSDLVQRVRRYASEVAEARNITLQVKAPGEDEDRRIEPALRRETFLIFKESLTNAVRHAGCTAIGIELAVERGALTFQLRDNGRGFDDSGPSQGNGLRNMRHRARSVGGTLDITPTPGGGTTVTFTGPRLRAGWRRHLPLLGGRRSGGRE